MVRNEIGRAGENGQKENLDLILLIVVILVGAAIRLLSFDQPIRYDEAFIYFGFASDSLARAFFYPVPNNHVVHSLLVKLSTSIFGPSPPFIRLPAYIAGVATLPFVYILSRRLTLGAGGLLSVALMAAIPYTVFYSTVARGYSLLVLLVILLILASLQLYPHMNWRKAAVLSAIAAIGMLNIPVMLYPVAGIYLWIAWLMYRDQGNVSKIVRSFFIPACSFTVLFTFLFYLPSIIITGDINRITANEFVNSAGWWEFWQNAKLHPHDIIVQFTRGMPQGVMLVFALFIGIGCYAIVRQRSQKLGGLLLCLVLSGILITFLNRRIPPVRVWIYMLPVFCILLDLGFNHLVRNLSVAMQRSATIVASMLVCAFLLPSASKEEFGKYPDLGAFPEAEVVAIALQQILNPQDLWYARTPANWPTKYYLEHTPPSQIHRTDPDGSPKTYYVIKNDTYSIDDFKRAGETVKIFAYQNASIYVSHRQGTVPKVSDHVLPGGRL